MLYIQTKNCKKLCKCATLSRLKCTIFISSQNCRSVHICRETCKACKNYNRLCRYAVICTYDFADISVGCYKCPRPTIVSDIMSGETVTINWIVLMIHLSGIVPWIIQN